MSAPRRLARQQLIDQIANTAHKVLKRGLTESTREFIGGFFERVPLEDIVDDNPQDLAGAALSIQQFGQVRRTGQVNLRALNPDRERDGWHSPHTVIEIVNDDMPFLVDSVVNELTRQGLTVHLTIHPIFRVKRTADDKLVRLYNSLQPKAETSAESYLHAEVTQQTDPIELDRLVSGLRRVLDDVRAAVTDWPAMRSRIAGILADLDAKPPLLPRHELSESKAFLSWLDKGNFTLLGFREYRFIRRSGRTRLKCVSGSGLGVLRDDSRPVYSDGRDEATLAANFNVLIEQPRLLLIGKSPCKATVHRNAHFDMIGVKQFDNGGHIVGQKLLLGLFTSAAYNRSPRFIPLLRKRIKRVTEDAGLEPNSHDGKSMLHILETFPRDELFLISDDDLLETATTILNLQERQRTAVCFWRDPFQRFMSCLVFVPAEQHNTVLRRRIQRILERRIGGKCRSFDTQIDQGSVLVRIYFTITTAPENGLHCDTLAIEREIAEAARSWRDRLHGALSDSTREALAADLLNRYDAAFGAAYQEAYSAAEAVDDIGHIESLLATGNLGMKLYRESNQLDYQVRFKIYNLQDPVPLSDALPVLEHLGLKVIEERPFCITPADRPPVWIHDFGLTHFDQYPIDLERVRRPFHEAFARVWSGTMEDDLFNSLVVSAGLSWRQVVLLRSYAKFLRQTHIPFSESYMQQAVGKNWQIVQHIIELFELLFDPEGPEDRTKAIDDCRQQIQYELDAVTSLDEDRIIRSFFDLVSATLRTNYFQSDADGMTKPYLAHKLNSQAIDILPLPRPMVEIFVYSPSVEGVHLRFGKVARGGLRWSDRREDFRTEVLGLVKAQQVKNAVIVPVGSKGGFIIKGLASDASREAIAEAGLKCYQTFVRGLLDLTDNYHDGTAQRPPRVICRDDLDPYLVVAADKGTASFSDVANAVATEYDFWLGDAFASGGSAGYDHKKMGITAAGAWESVKRHFRELDHDIQRNLFTVVGVGDMSGDVFGNAMLLSRHIRLIGAFNHLHIFVDPDPDPQRSFAERRRLFELPRSSWADYDTTVLSAGGAIFDRQVKSLTLSAAIKKRFGLWNTKVTPNDLIRALLKSNVDLLWFGGIGTYVKSSRESQADVGDRANDAARINGDELGAKVVGEGANLAMTQLGRVEYALGGGRLNTDAVDNSAGVSCSDHEVNIKILLGAVEHAGKLTRRQRNSLLQKMTDEVSELVLRDNYLQTGSLSVTKFIERRLTDRLANFMRALQRGGHLDRAVEFLPDDKTLAQRRAMKIGFARPELCILMAYAKIVLYGELLESNFPDDPALIAELLNYFPSRLHNEYGDAIEKHRLRREIVATVTTNSIVNRVGIAFAHEVMEKTGKQACDVARSYVITRRIFAMRQLWADIDDLDNRVPASLQASMHRETGRFMDRLTTWFLNNGSQPLDIGENVTTYTRGVRQTIDALDQILAPADLEYLDRKMAKFVDKGAPVDLARRIACLRPLVSACDIVRISHQADTTVERAGSLYFLIGQQLGIEWLRRQAAALPVDTHWDSQATTAIVEDMYNHQYLLTVNLLKRTDKKYAADKAIQLCCAQHSEAFNAALQTVQDIRSGGAADLSQLAVVNRQLRTLASQ